MQKKDLYQEDVKQFQKRLEEKKELMRKIMVMNNPTVQNQDDIMHLVESVLEERAKVGFKIKTREESYSYYGETLTPLYLNFIKDIFKQKFGPITREVVNALGDTIKTSINHFPSSYQEKGSCIKEIFPNKLFIHTNMSSQTMKSYIDNLADAINVKVEHKEPLTDPLMEEEQMKSDLPF